MIPRRLTLALLVVLVAACSSSQKPAQEAQAPSPRITARSVADTTWKLIELGGQPARADEQGNFPDLRLDSSQHRASGNAGCNRYFGSYSLAGDSLHFGPLASTKRACIDTALNAQETAFLQALDQARAWRIEGDTLTIGGASGPLARFLAGIGER